MGQCFHYSRPPSEWTKWLILDTNILEKNPLLPYIRAYVHTYQNTYVGLKKGACMDPKSICQEWFGARLNVSDFLILCSIEITWQERSGKEDVHQKLQPLQAQSFFQCKCIPGEVQIYCHGVLHGMTSKELARRGTTSHFATISVEIDINVGDAVMPQCLQQSAEDPSLAGAPTTPCTWRWIVMEAWSVSCQILRPFPVALGFFKEVRSVKYRGQVVINSVQVVASYFIHFNHSWDKAIPLQSLLQHTFRRVSSISVISSLADLRKQRAVWSNEICSLQAG